MKPLRHFVATVIWLSVAGSWVDAAVAADPPAGTDERIAQGEAAAPPPPSFPAPTDETVAALWQDFLERGTPASIAALDPIAEVFDADGEIDPDRCREQADALKRATAAAPVSLGAWYFARRCADAIGDAEWAATALDAFAVLSRHALLAYGADEWDPPIRVVAAIDIDAFLMASGDELLYRYIDLNSLPRAMSYRVALRESADGPVRRFRFDYLDTIMRLSDSVGWDVPAVRRHVVDSWIHDADADEDATDAAAVWDALAQPDAAARMSRLQSLGRAANLLAAFIYANACFEEAGDCASEAVDVLLPFAEARVPEAMVMLAYATASGRGTRADGKAAKALLEGAAERMGPGAYAQFAVTSQKGGSGGSLPRWARKPLQDAARAGDAVAVIGYAVSSASRKGTLSNEAVDLLEDLVREGSTAPAAYLLALRGIYGHEEEARVLSLLRVAAEARYEHAFKLLASMLERSSATMADEARRWRLEAARAGDGESMRKVGDWYADGAPPRDAPRARVWYSSAAQVGDQVAALSLAKLVLRQPPGLDVELSEAAEVLQELVALDNAEARRLYAELLARGHGVERDAASAERLLREGAAGGDLASQTMLGVLLAWGEFGRGREAEGVAELGKAGDQGHGRALNALALLRFWGVGCAADPALALATWERAITAGFHSAHNELAWHLCTAPVESFVDGSKGLEKIAALSALVDLSPAAIDTEAACHAAKGDFDNAVATQQRAIDAARELGESAAGIAGMEERLARYRDRQRTVISKPAFSRDDDPQPTAAAE